MDTGADGAAPRTETSPPSGPPQGGFHMSTEEFREHGHELVDWVADYLANVEQRPVRSGVEPGTVRGGLPALPPDGRSPSARCSLTWTT